MYLYAEGETYSTVWRCGHKLKNYRKLYPSMFLQDAYGLRWLEIKFPVWISVLYSCHLKWLGGPMKKCCKGGMTVDWLSSWFTGILIFPSYFFQIMFRHWQGKKQKRYYTVFEKDIRKAVCCQFVQTAKKYQSSQGSVLPLVGLVRFRHPTKKMIYSPHFFHSSDLPKWQGDIMMTRGLVAAREMKLGAFAKPVRAACLGGRCQIFVVG